VISVSELQELRIDAIYVPGNIRETVDEQKMAELVASVKVRGVRQAILVNANPQTQRLELVAGFRRLEAAKAAGLTTIPAVVDTYTPQEVDDDRIIENVQREDLTPLEEAKAIRAYLQRHNVTQAQLGERWGKSQAWVANRLRLLEAPESIQDYIRRGILSPSAAQEVLRAKDLPKGLERVEVRLKQEVERARQLFRDQGMEPPRGLTVDRVRLVVDEVIDGATADLSRCEFDPEAECADCEKKIEARWGLRCTDKACWKAKNKAGVEAKKAAIVEKIRAGEMISWQESNRVARAFDGCPGECEHRRKARIENAHSLAFCLNADSDCYKERARADRERENDWQARQKKVDAAGAVFRREEEERLKAVEGYLARRSSLCLPSVPEPTELRLLCLRVLRAAAYDPDECSRFAELALPELLAAAVEAVLREEPDVVYDDETARYQPTWPAYEQVRDSVIGRESEGEGAAPEPPEPEPHEEALAEQVAQEAEEALEDEASAFPCGFQEQGVEAVECALENGRIDGVPGRRCEWVGREDECDRAQLMEVRETSTAEEPEPQPGDYRCPYTKQLVDSETCRQCNDTVAAGGGGCCEYVIQGQAPFTCAACEKRHSCQTAQEQGVA